MANARRASRELRDAVRDLIEGEIRDAIREDGGDIAFEGMNGRTVRVRMGALCSLCPSGPRTVEHYVQKTLRERVDPGLSVAARFVKPYFAR